MDLLEQIKQSQTKKPEDSHRRRGFVNIYVGTERLDKMKEMAASVGMPVSTFMRSLIDVTINQEQDK